MLELQFHVTIANKLLFTSAYLSSLYFLLSETLNTEEKNPSIIESDSAGEVTEFQYVFGKSFSKSSGVLTIISSKSFFFIILSKKSSTNIKSLCLLFK